MLKIVLIGSIVTSQDNSAICRWKTHKKSNEARARNITTSRLEQDSVRCNEMLQGIRNNLGILT
ncbi:MAG: hypothetical protein P0116_06605 [Candidatus Nitrosocosmicus sp.]|nr:hypothetical protein [Candidatus Nitrosocosmicus sp.]